MKTLLEKFTEEEFEKMQETKTKTKMNWHDFLLEKCAKGG